MAAISEEDRKFLDSGDPEIDRVRYIVFIIYEFAEGFKLPTQEAFQYLDKFGGMDFLNDHCEYERTLPAYSTAMHLLEVCRNNGGWL